MQPGNGKYPVMFNQNKAHARDDEEEDSGEDGDSESDEKEEQAAAPAATGKQESPATASRDNDEGKSPPALKHMDKATRDAYYNTDELKGFAAEEDAAIKQQLDGQQLIQQTGPTLIKEVNGEIKNATPNWVSGKWVKNMKNAAKNA